MHVRHVLEFHFNRTPEQRQQCRMVFGNFFLLSEVGVQYRTSFYYAYHFHLAM
jgi:hypothetical protein